MKLYFTRHGESEANILREFSNRGLKHPLTEKGRLQAFELAWRLKEIPLERIYTSPVLRAIETAQIVAAELNVEYDIHDGLREFDTGVLEGRRDEASWAEWQRVMDDWMLHGRFESRIEGGESFYEMQARFVPLVEGLVCEYGQGDLNFLLVGHGGLYLNMLPLVLKNISRERIGDLPMGNTILIVSEARPEGLVCLDWGDLPML